MTLEEGVMKEGRNLMNHQKTKKILACLFLSISLIISINFVIAGQPTSSELCNDGIDNDGDGLIDGLVNLDSNNGQTFTVGTTFDSVYAFTKSKSPSLPSCPLGGNGNAMFLASVPWMPLGCSSLSVSQLHPTVTKICNLAGYKDPYTWDSYYPPGGRCNWLTPGDDCSWYWTGFSWAYNNDPFMLSNRFITSLKCVNKLSACSDGIDNDGDGKIDYPADNGCASANDNSEIAHDPDCDICNKNSDCGTNKLLNQLFCKSGNVYDKFRSYTCNNPGTLSSYCTYDDADQLIQTCAFGCSNAQCITGNCVDNDGDTYDTCNPGNPGDDGKQVDCNDNNSNINPGATETCNGIDDDCDGQIDENNGNCGQGKICSNGQCVNINCNSNSDCGTNKLLNQLFCKSGNVYDKFRTYTCNNPGTSSSSCTHFDSDQLIQTCSYGCFGGVCEGSKQCSNGIDDDNDGLIDMNDPGCSSPSDNDEKDCYTNNDCSQGKICYDNKCIQVTCNKNSDCGTDGYVGSNFCSGNKVYRDYKTYTCSNPGEISSSCSSSTMPILIQECCSNQVCSNGQCISVTCNKNSDCGTNKLLNQLFCKSGNVYDKFRSYTCNNPGTSSSSCTHSDSDQLIQTCAYGCSNNSCIISTCIDNDNDNYDTCNPGDPGDDGKQVDCNDNNPAINPGASEVCNDGIDNNCDGLIDTQDPLCKINECEDNIDNDNDNLIDSKDPGCWDDIDNSSSYNPNLDDEGRATIICNYDFDCGTDESSDKYCSADNIYQSNKDFTCLNPGLGSSVCKSSLSFIFIESCEYGCDNGVCESKPADKKGKYHEEEEEELVIIKDYKPVDYASLINQTTQDTQLLGLDVKVDSEKSKLSPLSKNILLISFIILIFILLLLIIVRLLAD